MMWLLRRRLDIFVACWTSCINVFCRNQRHVIRNLDWFFFRDVVVLRFLWIRWCIALSLGWCLHLDQKIFVRVEDAIVKEMHGWFSKVVQSRVAFIRSVQSGCRRSSRCWRNDSRAETRVFSRIGRKWLRWGANRRQFVGYSGEWWVAFIALEFFWRVVGRFVWHLMAELSPLAERVHSRVFDVGEVENIGAVCSHC